MAGRPPGLVRRPQLRLSLRAWGLLCTGLAMNWRDFLALAARLAAGASESEWRSAASRAYYAAFHVARELLSDLRFLVPRADRAHQYLTFRLSNCGDAAVIAAGRNLETLRRLRNRADYDPVPPFPQAEATAA